jgi:hypothetical protein
VPDPGDAEPVRAMRPADLAVKLRMKPSGAAQH